MFGSQMMFYPLLSMKSMANLQKSVRLPLSRSYYQSIVFLSHSSRSRTATSNQIRAIHSPTNYKNGIAKAWKTAASWWCRHGRAGLFEFWAVCLDILVIHEILAQLIGHEFNSLVQNLRVCKLTENNSLFSFFFFSCFFNQDWKTCPSFKNKNIFL